ncbi:MAG TPA: hypothetical protein VHR47_14275 [Bacillota bacterium]|jgi:hypothetical protein|nr:hypothetical protein [Bacillota bacterium]
MVQKKLKKPGTKVAHKIFGHGVILGPSDDPNGLIVRFDRPNAKWGTDTIEVSTSLLTKRWGRMARDEKDPPSS